MVATEPISIAAEFRIGKTYIRISDDYCKNKTPQDVQQILRRIADRAIRRINAVATERTI